MTHLSLLLPLVLPLVGVQAQGNDAPPPPTGLWGAYRPNLYFGLRPKLPQSLLTGLMWCGLEDYQSISKTRHEASDSDGLASYTWTHFVPGEGGVQTLLDPVNNLNLTTSYVVLPGEGGEAWAARISGQPIDADKRSRNALLWYTGVDGYGQITLEDDDSPLSWTGKTPDLGPFTINIRTNKGSIPEADHPGFPAQPPESWSSASSSFSSHADVSYAAIPVPVGSIWQAKEAILQQLLKSAQETLASYGQGGPFPDPATVLHLPDDVYTSASLWAVQLNFDGPFEFDISFTPGKESTAIAAPALTAALDIVKAKYEAVFTDVFPTDELHATFSKEITANLLGGVGYFHGTSLVDRSFRYDWDEEEAAPSSGEGPELTEPRALLTATPSRSFFPRGFYWDEGFHLLPIARLFPSLAAEILESWVGLIDEDGWVGREQILGEEARSRVPAEFQVQVPNYGNPPTLVMAVQALLQAPSTGDLSLEDLGMDGQVPMGMDAAPSREHDLSPEERTTILRRLYPALKRHYDWFRRTQRGLLRPYGRRPRSRTEAYRWRGRSPTHVLTSGMDDYPRPHPPSQGELHLDLLSWMAFFSRTMAELAEHLGGAYEDDAESYRMVLRGCLDNLHDLHWSEEDEAFCDASVDEEDEHVLVCHKGYLTLFPFMLELLGEGDEAKIEATIDLIRDERELWTPFGIASLSKSHSLFGQGENYWRGPIWVQMNFMVLKALRGYSQGEGELAQKAAKVYGELRTNVVKNVFEEYTRTGYVWEQYDALTGEGKRSHPFTGWTSMVTLILSEKY